MLTKGPALEQDEINSSQLSGIIMIGEKRDLHRGYIWGEVRHDGMKLDKAILALVMLIIKVAVQPQCCAHIRVQNTYSHALQPEDPGIYTITNQMGEVRF